jgi:hypothetical protein
MSSLLISAALGLLSKLVTEVFFAKIVAKSMLIYAAQSPNKYDDAVAEATAEAFGMPVDEIKKYMEKPAGN